MVLPIVEAQDVARPGGSKSGVTKLARRFAADVHCPDVAEIVCPTALYVARYQ